VTCPDEITVAIWLDDELDAEARRGLEIHLVQCQRCRERVLALRDESDLLADVLHDREPPAVVPRPVEAPARGLAVGLVPAAAAVALLLAAVGWALESLPSGFDWMNPFQYKGATEMLFKVLFVIRDEAPELMQLALAVAATAGLSAVLTFAVGAVMRRVARPGAMCLMALLLAVLPAPGEAHFGMHEHEDFDLAASETHRGTLIVSGGTVNIDGTVDGDLIAFAERLTLRGEVRGNVYSFSENAELAGTVRGSAHVGADRAEITGRVDGNLYAGAEQIEIAPSGEVGGDAAVWTGDGILEGRVGRDLHLAGRRVELRGPVGGDVFAHRVGLALRSGARIDGDVRARVQAGDEVDASDDAEVRGEIVTEKVADPHRMWLERYRSAAFYGFLAVQLVAAFAFGMLLHALVPTLFANRLDTTNEFFRTVGIGLLGIVCTPIVLTLVAVTLVGIPIALIGGALYVAALYASTVLVGALVGEALVRPDDSGAQSFGLALLAGVAAVLVLSNLPFLGIPIRIVVGFVGVGLVIERLRATWNARRVGA